MNGPKVESAALEKSDQMLEYLEHPQVLADLYQMGSDNLGGGPRTEEPGNQQERLVNPNWVIGFVDGEGCFSIGLIRQPDRVNRKGYRTGFHGLIEILEIMQTMNRQKPRHDEIRILRDHTSDVRDIG